MKLEHPVLDFLVCMMYLIRYAAFIVLTMLFEGNIPVISIIVQNTGVNTVKQGRMKVEIACFHFFWWGLGV